jgi:hypothetical protein
MEKYRSLERIIREMSMNRNTELRKKVANVGRPDDNVKDETSNLAKQGEIKTKIIDEADMPSAHKMAKSMVKGFRGHKTELHPDGSATVHTKGGVDAYHRPTYSSANVVDSHLKNHGFDYNHPAKEYDNHTQSKNGHTVRVSRTATGHSIHISSNDVKETVTEAEEHKVGDKVHAGFGAKGGAGYRGTVHKVEKDHVHVNLGKGVFGDRIVKAPKKFVTKEGITESSAINKDDVETKEKDADGIVTNDERKKKTKDLDDPKKIKGGKTEVDLKPVLDNKSDSDKEETKKSKSATTKSNKEIGVNESTMTNKNFGLPESVINSVRQILEKKGECPKCGMNPCQCGGDPKPVKEDLKGGQKKIDANMAVGAKNRDDQHLGSRGMKTNVADKIRGREKMSGKNRQQFEETDPGFTAEELARIEQIAKGFDK